MDAIAIFFIFFAALVVVYLDVYYDIPMLRSISYVASAATVLLFIAFMYFPYSELPNLDAKAAKAIELSAYCMVSVLISFIAGLASAYKH